MKNISKATAIVLASLSASLVTSATLAQATDESRNSTASESPSQAAPDSQRLQAIVEKLVSFGTRHSLSEVDDPERGIGAARAWVQAEFENIAAQCGGCLRVERIGDHVQGRRIPNGAYIENVLAIQQGRGYSADSEPHVIILAAHLDSRATDPLDFTSDAPGANDNASGSALVIEAARILSQHQPRATIVYALLSGEEQGLWGARILTKHAQQQQWQVAAFLNNDVVGGTRGTNGAIVRDRVRIFSEGLRISEDESAQRARRMAGGEDDGVSRALAKAGRQVARENIADIGLEVLLVRRPDRFSRGGDHLPALEVGYPAVRFSVGIEDYDHQHQNVRTENGRKYGDTVDEMDFDYLARVTRLNVALTKRLANAPPAPRHVYISGAVSSDTTVAWQRQSGASGYRVYWRRTDRGDWNRSDSRLVSADTSEVTLSDIIIDDHFFGVSAVGTDGSESIVSFAGPRPR